MSENHAISPALQPTSVPEDSEHYLHSKTEIVSILKDIQESRVPAALFYGGGQSMMTAVLKVSAVKDLIYLDCNINEELNEQVEASRKLIFVSNLRSVKVQFTIPRIEITQWNDEPAFVIKLPKAIVRLQRREFYRIPTPTLDPVICTIPLPDGSSIKATVADISAGGIGIMGAPEEMRLEPMMSYENCQLALPGSEAVLVNLQAREIFNITLKNNVEKKRAGMEFLKMSNHTQSIIQRYIMKLEMERRIKEQGSKWD
ncbi:MAG: flagellar brake protein [Burkholderiales bacterium]